MTRNGEIVGGWRSVVTGAETELGRRIAVELVKQGSSVDLLGADGPGTAVTADLLRGTAPEALGRVEVADPTDVRSVADACRRLAVNDVHALVHAGIYATDLRIDGPSAPWLTMVNVIAPYVATRILGRALGLTPYGRVVFLSPPYIGDPIDIEGLRGSKGIQYFSSATGKARSVLSVEFARRYHLNSRIIVVISGIQPGPGANSRQTWSYQQALKGAQNPLTRWFSGPRPVDQTVWTAASLATYEPTPGDAERWCVNSIDRWHKFRKDALDPAVGGSLWNLCEELSAAADLRMDDMDQPS